MFGLTVNESTRGAVAATGNDRYRQLIFIGTSASAVAGDQNKLIEIRDLATFVTKFGTASPSYRSIQYAFQVDPYAVIQFICGRDPGNTQILNLQFAISTLVSLTGTESAILVCAEGQMMTTQADRTALFAALDSYASGARRRHLNYWNTALATNTKALALTERALYTSALGSSILCYEYLETVTSIFVPLAVHQAVYHLKQSRSTPFDPPSGYSSAITGVVGVRNNNVILTEADWMDFNNNNINVPVQLPDRTLCIWGGRNLSGDPNLMSINSRVSLTITNNVCRDTALPYLQESSDKDGSLARGLERDLFGALERLYTLGAYSADNGDITTAFRVEMVPETSGNKKRLTFNVYVRLIDTLETVVINLNSVQIIQAA